MSSRKSYQSLIWFVGVGGVERLDQVGTVHQTGLVVEVQPGQQEILETEGEGGGKESFTRCCWSAPAGSRTSSPAGEYLCPACRTSARGSRAPPRRGRGRGAGRWPRHSWARPSSGTSPGTSSSPRGPRGVWSSTPPGPSSSCRPGGRRQGKEEEISFLRSGLVSVREKLTSFDRAQTSHSVYIPGQARAVQCQAVVYSLFKRDHTDQQQISQARFADVAKYRERRKTSVNIIGFVS